jgi:hypothetical protein
MTEPSPESVQRGVAALIPFQRTYQLSLNPEDLAEMAYAVLRFANSAKSHTEIVEAVEELVANHLAENTRMMEAMKAAIRERDESK